MKHNSRQFTCCLILVLSMILTGCNLFTDTGGPAEKETSFSWNDTGEISDPDCQTSIEQNDPKTSDMQAVMLCVHVCGCVNQPGLYELPEGSRIGNAIEEAGGFAKSASEESVNLAAFIEDGMQIYVPSEKELSEGTGQGQDSTKMPSRSGLINLNTATQDELMNLSGIGESKAKAIIAYREENGSFHRIEDIKKVSGIGDSTYENIKNDITVS